MRLYADDDELPPTGRFRRSRESRGFLVVVWPAAAAIDPRLSDGDRDRLRDRDLAERRCCLRLVLWFVLAVVEEEPPELGQLASRTMGALIGLWPPLLLCMPPPDGVVSIRSASSSELGSLVVLVLCFCGVPSRTVTGGCDDAVAACEALLLSTVSRSRSGIFR